MTRHTKSLSIVIVGFGTVGQGLASLLVGREDIRVAAIADTHYGNVVARDPEAGLDLRRVLALVEGDSRIEAAGKEFYGDALALLDSLSPYRADVLVEATPSNFETGRPALDYIRRALELGMHVAAANKGPFACQFDELSRAAAGRRLRLEFEGTVMSGTPVIRICHDLLSATNIRAVRGVLNGTVNHILTEMMKGQSYESALGEAQAAGIAEADPSADVEGFDAAAKAAILANLAFREPLTIRQIERVGIAGLKQADMEEARRAGKVWKQVTSLTRSGGEVRGRVAPELLSPDDPLSRVDGTANILEIQTEALGKVAITGPGAGRIETGFAVLCDLLEIQKSLS